MREPATLLFRAVIEQAIQDAFLDLRAVKKGFFLDFNSNEARWWLTTNFSSCHLYLQHLGVNPESFEWRIKKILAEKEPPTHEQINFLLMTGQ